MSFSRAKRALLFAGIAVLILVSLITGILVVRNQSSSDNVTATILGALEGKSLDDLKLQSSLIARGIISKKSEPFQIKPVRGGGVLNYTDYTLEPIEILRGNEPATISIRVCEGTADHLTVVSADSPNFKIGDEYLLFLCQPGMGGAYNTQGDYYYVLGINQGVFSSDDGVNYTSMYNEKISYAEFEVEIQALNKTNQIDYHYFRNQFIENQKRNLETGFITKEEYDQLLADIDRYAKIVD